MCIYQIIINFITTEVFTIVICLYHGLAVFQPQCLDYLLPWQQHYVAFNVLRASLLNAIDPISAVILVKLATQSAK